jgi:predicted MFS family arabinose efflux permease
VLALAAGGLFLVAQLRGAPVWPIYAIAVAIGTARAFAGPAAQALVPDLVPAEHFENAVTWGALVHRLGHIVGPALGGGVYALFKEPQAVYGVCAVTAAVATLLLLFVSARPIVRTAASVPTLKTLFAGLAYVWRRRVILGSISLDLFAVLLGGATALLPIFARDILHTGPGGLGLLRAAPSWGAAAVALWLARFPLKRRAGEVMLACVVMFGAATIVFGLSQTFWLSLVALAITGATDMVSVVIRLTLVQVATPPDMRGRVSAVNMLFIGASNELGEFESGVVAQWLGAVPAVVLGGVGTILVVAIWAYLFPELRKIQRVEDERARA